LNRNRTLLLAGIAAGAALGWLAFDPPAPREAGASSSRPPAGKTGAPSEGLCSECHTGNTVNDGLGSVAIGGVPAAYTPSQTYTLTATVQHSGQLRWGFELTVLKNSDSTAVGALANTTLLTTTQISLGRTYMSHTTLNGQDGTFSGFPSGSWTFDWTAPVAGAGTVTFYAAGNAANGTGSTLGDFIYSTSVASMEATSTDVSPITWGKIKMLYR
jgi:cytochrome c553